jgi:hypothetical protein
VKLIISKENILYFMEMENNESVDYFEVREKLIFLND